jgi:hypothetical protein
VPGVTLFAPSRDVGTSRRDAPIAVRVSSCGARVVVAMPALPLAFTVSGEPASPLAVTVIDCVPTTAPSVHVVLAAPVASVVSAAAPSVPFVVAKLTITPATGLAYGSVTRTMIGDGSGDPGAAV